MSHSRKKIEREILALALSSFSPLFSLDDHPLLASSLSSLSRSRGRRRSDHLRHRSLRAVAMGEHAQSDRTLDVQSYRNRLQHLADQHVKAARLRGARDESIAWAEATLTKTPEEERRRIGRMSYRELKGTLHASIVFD